MGDNCKEGPGAQGKISMATSSGETGDEEEVEETVRKVVTEQLEMRYRCSETLQQLLTRRHERATATGQQTPLEDLIHRMSMADAIIRAQLRDLCLQPQVDRRERASQDTNQERDSGYSPSPATSADMGAARRQAVFLRASTVAAALPVGESPVEMGLPEITDPPTLTSGYTALVGHVAGEPTEHSDSSPQDDTT